MLKYKDKNFISLVILLSKNSKENEIFVRNLCTYLNENFINFEFVLIFSTSTADQEILSIVLSSFEKVKVNKIYLGDSDETEVALRTGFDSCIGDYIFTIERINSELDFVKNVFETYRLMLKGYEVAELVTLNYSSNKEKIFYFILNNFALNKNKNDKIFPVIYNIVSRRAYNRLKDYYKNSLNRSVEIFSLGLKKLTTTTNNPTVGVQENRVSSYLNIIIIFTDFFLKLSLTSALLMLIISLFTLIYTFYFYFFRDTLQGWTTIMGFLSFSFFAVFLILYIIIIYQGMIFRKIYFKN